jgi:hypothetical protein
MNNIETVGSSGSEKDLTDTEGSAGTRPGDLEVLQDNITRMQQQAAPPVNLVLRMR